MTKQVLSLALVAGLTVGVGSALGAPMTAGNVAVYRVDGGLSTTLGSSTTNVYVDEYTPAGVFVQTIAMPTASSGSQMALTAVGNSAAEGYLSAADGGRYIAIPGYNTGTGTASASSNSAIARTIGILDTQTGLVDTSTGITGLTTNPRSATVSADGTKAYLAVSSSVYYTAPAAVSAGTAVVASQSGTSFSSIDIISSQLYGAASGTAGNRLGNIGTGLPTSTGQSLTAILTTAGGPAAFVLLDLNPNVAGYDTAYATALVAGAGILKYSFNGSTWSQVGGNTAIAGTDVFRGLDASVDALGNVTLFATRALSVSGTSGTSLVKIIDSSGPTGAINGTYSTLATPTTGQAAFRGVQVIVPTPGAASLAGLGMLAAGRRRR